MDHNDSRPNRRSLKRSRSPHGAVDGRDVKRHHHRHNERGHLPKKELPFESQPLHKHDFENYKALFAEYLSLQKSLDIKRLTEDEVKGRWKSFIGKWNRGELAEGWYDVDTKKKADGRFAADGGFAELETFSRSDHDRAHADNEEEENDHYGPTLPSTTSTRKSGPTGCACAACGFRWASSR